MEYNSFYFDNINASCFLIEGEDDLLKNLDFSKKNVKEIIKYLLDLGVEDIYTILIRRVDLFFLPVSLVKQNFTKLDKNMLVYLLNNSIDDLINYNI